MISESVQYLTYTWGHLSCRGQISEEVGTQILLFYFIRYEHIIYGIVLSKFSSITGCLTSQQINHLDCLLMHLGRVRWFEYCHGEARVKPPSITDHS